MTDTLKAQIGTSFNDNACRWGLKRRWAQSGPVLGWVMLNPSTADEQEDDPTIRRIIGFSKRAGYSALQVENLTPVRSTDPDQLIDHINVISNKAVVLRNYQRIKSMHKRMDVVVAWGARYEQTKRWPKIFEAMSRCRDAALSETAHKTLYLAKTKSQEPRHPLMIPNAQALRGW